jgi:peptidoglycan DL-endopeptidase CwlO
VPDLRRSAVMAGIRRRPDALPDPSRVNSSRKHARRRLGALAVVLAVTLGTLGTPIASAEPTPTPGADQTGVATPQPKTPADAKAAWIAAAQTGNQLNDAYLLAEEAVAEATVKAAAAQSHADSLKPAVLAADAQVAIADAEIAVFRPKLNLVANASLRGAYVNQASSLFTAPSPQAYLDQMAALDRIAAGTLETMGAARAAKAVADAAKVAAVEAHAEAQRAVDEATAAVAAANQAKADAQAKKDALTEQILVYEQLYSALSVAERGQALEAFEASNVSPEAQAILAEQAAQRAAAGITDALDDVTVSELAVRDAPDVVSGIAVAAALTRRGLPYVWGATGPRTFDCSGLMLWAWAQAGITIPRTSLAQSKLPSVPLDKLQPGDLVTYYSPVSHVGMYVGNGLVVHASMPGVPIRVVPMLKSGAKPTGHRVPR